MRITVFLAPLVVVATCGSFVSSKAYALGEPDYHTIGVRSLRGDDLTEERIKITPIVAESVSARLNSEAQVLNENIRDVQQIKELQEKAAHGNGAVHPNAPTLEEKGKAVMVAGNGENKLEENVPVVDGEKATDTAAAAENPSRWNKMWHSVKSKFKSDKAAAEGTLKEVEHGLPETELTKMWDTLSPAEKKMMEENNVDIKLLSERHPETVAKVFALAVNGARSQKSTYVKVLQWTLAAFGTAAVLYILFHWITGSAKPATSSTMTVGGA